MPKTVKLLLLSVVLVLVAAGCGGGSEENADNGGGDEVEVTQAMRGEEVFNTICIECHIPEGGGEGPKLERRVLASYKSANRLHGYISKYMPDNKPGSLEPQQYYDVVAYLLVDRGFVEEAPEVSEATLESLKELELTKE